MSDNTQVKREAPERICLHAETLKRMHGYIYPASDKWPGDIEYVRADLLATIRREEREAAFKEASASHLGESAWLLEKMREGNVHYIAADYVLQWTDDPNKALRLARREDAEALCTIVEDCEKIAEHGWPAPASPAAIRDEAETDNYVAWCRYTYDAAGSIKSIVTCDSDAKGAFRVYRASVATTPRSALAKAAAEEIAL